MAFGSSDSKDGISYTGARTANAPTFQLLGGKYMMANTTPSTSVELDVLMPDGTTYVAVMPAFTTANTAFLDLAPGTYKFVFVATADVSGFIQRVATVPSL